MNTIRYFTLVFSILLVNACKQEAATVFGIDISHHNNHELDPIKKYKDSIQFIICKATEGVTYSDPDFKKNWNRIRNHDFIRGAYHFYKSTDDPVAQAKFFYRTISDIEKTDLPPIVDFENRGLEQGQSVEDIQSNFLIFLSQITRYAKVKPIIYTNLNSANTYLDSDFFKEYPLWIADYNGTSQPKIPKTWEAEGYLFWQKTATYKATSILTDADVFHGTLDELKAFIKRCNEIRPSCCL